MQKTVKIVIIGASGNGFDIVDTIHDLNQKSGYQQYECTGFLDDKQELQGKTVYFDYKVLGKIADTAQFADNIFFATAIGSSKTFLKKQDILSNIPLNRFVTLVHPTAYISKTAQLGTGSIVLQNVTIANNVVIGNQVVILANTIINHDCVIGDYSCIASNVSLSGGVKMGENCYTGTNTAVRENVTIGKKCLIGMGSNVLQDIPDYSVVMGNPARITGTTQKL